jgi:tripartite motif-containing protein 71
VDYQQSARAILVWLVTALLVLTYAALDPGDAGAQVLSANGAAYECMPGPAHPATPPPLPTAVAKQAKTEPAVRPLCTDGEVPAIVSSAPQSVNQINSELKVLPTETPVESLEPSIGSGTGVKPLNSSGCPLYSNGAYYCHVVEAQESVSGGKGLWGWQSQQAPLVDPTELYAHSISQLWAIDRTTGSDVEFGWTVDPGLFPTDDSTSPHLFVFWFDGGYAGEYDPPYEPNNPEGTKWIPYSEATEAPGEPVTSTGEFHEYGVTKDEHGNWWFYHDGNWLGYFPAHDWTHAPFTSYTGGETGGEVEEKDTSQICSQMGNGEVGTSGTAAMWREAWKETEGAGDTYLVPTGYGDEEGAPVYTYGNLDSEIGQFRYGGNGFTACKTNVPPILDYSPTIPYSVSQGVPVTATSGAWINSPTSYTYQWNRCSGESCTAIPGATSSTYTPGINDGGYTLTVTETAYNAYGQSSATSNHSYTVPYSPPLITGLSATGVTYTEATLNGDINAAGASTKYHFEYWPTGGSTVSTSEQTLEPGSERVPVPANAHVAKLKQHETYHFRIIAANAGGGTTSEEQVFATPSSVTTGSASGVTDSEVTLHGIVNPHGVETKYYFEYGLEKENYKYKTAEAPAGSGTTNVEVSKAVAELLPRRTYHFRIVATNGSPETAYGEDHTVKTAAVPPAFQSAFGSCGSEPGDCGSGDGEFWHSAGVAVGGNGDVWVVDQENDRVQEFNEKQEFIRTFGWGVGNGEAKLEVCTSACRAGIAGSGEGEFRGPSGIAVSASGDVWVADKGNNRVEEFNEKGEVLHVFGSKGTGKGEFGGYGPDGIAVEGGSVWVSDTQGGRIEKFSEEGTFEAAYGFGVTNGKAEYQICTSSCKVGITGSGHGQFGEPEGIAVGPTGNVWVTDWVDNRVTELNAEGKYVREVGAEGKGNGEFYRPYAITVDSNGIVWVGDTYNQRVQEFNEEGEYLSQFGSAGYEPDQFELYPAYGIAVDAKGDIWVSDPTNNRIEKWRIPGYASFQSAFGSCGSEPGDCGSGDGEFWHSAGVAVDGHGNVWVVDQENDRVQEFNEKQEFIRTFGWGVSNGKAEPEVCTSGCKAGIAGSGIGQLDGPGGVAVDSKGDVWVADKGNYRVEEFNEKGEWLQTFGSKGTGDGEFGGAGPDGIAVEGGNIWVSDTQGGRIEEFAEKAGKAEFVKAYGWGVTNGKAEYEICTSACKAGITGSGAGQFGEPEGIAVGPTGNLWVTDWLDNRVTELNEKGEYVREVGSEGKGNGQFYRPYAIAVDSSGNVWVGDTYNQRVQEFNEEGEYLNQFGSAGYERDQVELYPAYGITVDSKGDIWASDPTNNRIEKWLYSR